MKTLVIALFLATVGIAHAGADPHRLTSAELADLLAADARGENVHVRLDALLEATAIPRQHDADRLRALDRKIRRIFAEAACHAPPAPPDRRWLVALAALAALLVAAGASRAGRNVPT